MAEKEDVLHLFQEYAKQKIAEAKKKKHQRLKVAKDSINLEIEDYKAKKEAEYKTLTIQHKNLLQEIVNGIEKEAKETSHKISGIYNERKEEIIKAILDCVFNVKPKMHKNYSLK